MTIHDQDTDPSTPGARQPSASRASRATPTDPGVGPPSKVVDGKPTGVVVPSPGRGGFEGRAVTVFASATRKKDSVELLLEGIAGPRPDRVKTMPRTAGEAAAAYHAEHAVHAAHTSPDDEPKVMVERSPFDPRDRTDPSRRSLPLAEVPAGWGAADPTHVPPKSLVLRVVLAALAGLLVVVGIFVAVDRAPPPDSVSAPALAPAPTLTSTYVPLPTRPVEPAVAMTEKPPVDIPEAPPATATASPAVPSAAPGPQARANKGRSRASTPAADLGEFKSTF
jgi:hypothetical protein